MAINGLILLNQTKIDSNHTFSIDLSPIGIPFGGKPIRNVQSPRDSSLPYTFVTSDCFRFLKSGKVVIYYPISPAD